MKIDSSNPLRSASGSKAKRTTGAGGGFADMLGGGDDGGTAASGGSTGPTGTTALTSLLAIQEQADDGQRSSADQQAAQHGEDQLARLEALRRDLLLGQVSTSRLQTLAEQSAQRLPPSDPQLASILDDIDLRVQVELAKRGL